MLFRVQGVLLALIALMFLIFFAQQNFEMLWYWPWMAVPADVLQSFSNLRQGTATAADWHHFSTLLSHAFLHGSFEHVAYNMLFFWIFGALIVELIGTRWMLMIFTLTAISGGMTHILLNREDVIPMLGASGALMGFEGAYLGLATRWHLPDPHVWPIAHPIPPGNLGLVALIGVTFDYFSIISKVDGNIAYGAHLGGFAAGLLIAALAAPRPRGARATTRY